MRYRCPKCGLTTTSPGRCPEDGEHLDNPADNPVQRLLGRHGTLVFLAVCLLVIAGILIADAINPPKKTGTWCEEHPKSVLCEGGEFRLPTGAYYEEELGSRGSGYYYYGYPDWDACIQSGGYVVSQGTSGDDAVTCRFYYSGS